MKKIWIVIIGLLVLSIFLYGCVKVSVNQPDKSDQSTPQVTKTERIPPSGYTVYNNQGVSFFHHRIFMKKENQKPNELVYLEPEPLDNTIDCTFDVTREKNALSLDQYSQTIVATVNKMTESNDVTASDITLAGLPGKEVSYSDTTLVSKFYITSKDGMIYTIVYMENLYPRMNYTAPRCTEYAQNLISSFEITG
jgi:hypothetical protein